MKPATLRRVAAIGIFVLSLAALLPLVLEKPLGVVSANPGDQAVLATAPDAVSLTFAREIDPNSAHITVLDADGRAVLTGRPTIGEFTLGHPVAITGDGAYQATYHVRLAGGAIATGSIGFAVGEGIRPPVPSGGHAHGGPIDPVTGVMLGANVVALLVIGWKLTRRRRPEPTP